MVEKQLNQFVYESSRHKILMEEYSKLSKDNEYIDWGKRAQAVAAYMSNAISNVNNAIVIAKSSLEKEGDKNKQRNIKIGLMQYENLSKILQSQLDNLIKVMDNLPTGPVKPIIKEILTPDTPYAKIFVGKSEEVTLNGKITNIDNLKNDLMTLAQKDGIVLYTRESPDTDPPAIAKIVIKLIIDNHLSIYMCKNNDFSDVVDSNGKLRIKN